MTRTTGLLCFAFAGTLALACRAHPSALGSAGGSGTGQPVTTTGATFETSGATTTMPDVATLAAKVRPMVVNVTTTHTVRAREMFDPFSFFDTIPGRGGNGRRQPSARAPEERVLRHQALGSGFIIDVAGHVVTNAHVVESADQVKVKLADDREFDAKVLGRDPRLDIAVLELSGAKDLPFANLGDSDDTKVGEYVVAVGNPLGLGHTVTMGIVSAKSRAIGAGPYDDFIQTDASINPGNSGGPLFNMRAQVVGINTAIAASAQGIGFAIPSNALKEVLPQLLTKGHVDRGRIGVSVQPVDDALAKALGLPKPDGALVGEVEKGGPADRARLVPGDVIVAVDGTPVAHSQDLPRMVARHAPGTNVKLDVIHDTHPKSVEVALAKLGDESSEIEQTPSGREQGPGTRGGELGVALGDAPGGGGAVVERVSPSGPAHESLEAGDVITEVNHRAVHNAGDAALAVRSASRGEPLLFTVRREGHQRLVAIERK
jgi:serine protease Do